MTSKIGMLDFFVIMTKGGIVLLCIQNSCDNVRLLVNHFVSTIVKSECSPNPILVNNQAIQYHIDNEFELVYVVGYQKILQLTFVDKFLSSAALKFRDLYKNQIVSKDFSIDYDCEGVMSDLISKVERDQEENLKSGKKMRKFEESEKSQKTVSSMIQNGAKGAENGSKKSKASSQKTSAQQSVISESTNDCSNGKIDSRKTVEDEIMQKKLQKLNEKMNKTNKTSAPVASNGKTDVKKGKVMRKWDSGATGEEAAALDFSNSNNKKSNGDLNYNGNIAENLSKKELEMLNSFKGKLKGDLDDVEISDDDEEYDDNENPVPNSEKKPSSFNFVTNYLKSVTGRANGPITKEQLKPCMDELKEHLVGKNVAGEIAQKLCDGVAEKLVGLQLGTFERLTSRVKSAMEESCVRLLSSARRVDVLRDIIAAKNNKRPYSIVFCGVNGVGKSTNLAKISFWLTEKNFRVLIAACDTFRSGAVEQLRTHVQKLNYIHPPEPANGNRIMVELYEKGYGKDAAGIASSAINYAKDNQFDVVLVDTAGRMQDNEPLMKALAKLINVNDPNLVLFVGEALVGNEAVDQLKKFNQSLADHSFAERPRGIDGIVLSKFDTIDDKVGAAISMAYISGQPIVFVGTGQTYGDLRHLSVPTIVKLLLK